MSILLRWILLNLTLYEAHGLSILNLVIGKDLMKVSRNFDKLMIFLEY